MSPATTSAATSSPRPADPTDLADTVGPMPAQDAPGGAADPMTAEVAPPPADDDDYRPVMPPTQDELPCSDGIPMESERHWRAMELLINSLEPWLERRFATTGKGGYVGGNMFLYFSLEQTRTRDFRGPDVLVALDVEPKERKSFVVWEEGKSPEIVIELLSVTTRAYDKAGKKTVYQNRARIPEYYWFDVFRPEDFAGFELHHLEYQAIEPDGDGRLLSRSLGLCLGRWHGTFHGIEAVWLRWYTPDGALLPTGEEEAAERAAREAERAAGEAERADREAERADREAERADRLARELRARGIDPDELP